MSCCTLKKFLKRIFVQKCLLEAVVSCESISIKNLVAHITALYAWSYPSRKLLGTKKQEKRKKGENWKLLFDSDAQATSLLLYVTYHVYQYSNRYQILKRTILSS